MDIICSLQSCPSPQRTVEQIVELGFEVLRSAVARSPHTKAGTVRWYSFNSSGGFLIWVSDCDLRRVVTTLISFYLSFLFYQRIQEDNEPKQPNRQNLSDIF